MNADCNFRTNYFLMLYNGYVFYILEMSDKFCKKNHLFESFPK